MSKIKIEIKNRWAGKILFEYESGNNTVKETVFKALQNGADLRGADLREADLREADLREADLREADLCEADLREADLREADLCGADLREANLRGADLREADLREADLCGANLCEADLRGADLCGADLCGADLREADLRGADLCGADLCGADLREADWKKIKHLFQIIPEEGSFIAYKKLAGNCIAQIEIPAKAKRLCNTVNRKCRASYIKTLKIWDTSGKEIKEQGGDKYFSTKYKVDRITRPDSFDPDPFEDCSHGIHFFITKQEALDW